MGTHYLTRDLGHDVRQVPAFYAKPFRQAHKNDFCDALAVAEAVQRPTTRCVAAKTWEQLDLQALHRVRSRLVGERTAIINQIPHFSSSTALALAAPFSAGDRTILGRITKRGNRYLRMLFMQAARVVLLRPANWMNTVLGRSLLRPRSGCITMFLATALANKLARVAWSVLAKGPRKE